MQGACSCGLLPSYADEGRTDALRENASIVPPGLVLFRIGFPGTAPRPLGADEPACGRQASCRANDKRASGANFLGAMLKLVTPHG